MEHRKDAVFASQLVHDVSALDRRAHSVPFTMQVPRGTADRPTVGEPSRRRASCWGWMRLRPRCVHGRKCAGIDHWKCHSAHGAQSPDLHKDENQSWRQGASPAVRVRHMTQAASVDHRKNGCRKSSLVRQSNSPAKRINFLWPEKIFG